MEKPNYMSKYKTKPKKKHVIKTVKQGRPVRFLARKSTTKKVGKVEENFLLISF